MRILFVIDDKYPISGGSTRVVAQLSAGLIANGYQVAIIAPKGSVAEHEESIIESPVLFIPFAQEGSLLYSRNVMQQALAFSPDIIHSHSERYALNYAQKLAKKTGTKHVHTMHGNYAGIRKYYPLGQVVSIIVYLLSLSALFRKQSKLISFRKSVFDKTFWDNLDIRSIAQFALSADAAVTPSHYHYEHIGREAFGQTHLIPTGHSENVAVLKPFRTMTNVLSVGRVCREKRSMVTLKAFHVACSKNLSLRLHIVGTGPHLKKLKSYVKRHKLKNTVIFYGQINEREVLKDIYTNSDVFLQSSYRFETQGLVFLEAASTGLPIIYCDDRLKVGVNEYNAILTGPSYREIAAGLSSLTKESELCWSKMSQASLNEAEKWPFSNTLQSHVELYKKLKIEL